MNQPGHVSITTDLGAAINALWAQETTVRVSGDTGVSCPLSTTITVPIGKTLIFEPGATVIVQANVDVFQPEYNSRVWGNGALIDTSQITFTSNVFRFTGNASFRGQRPTEFGGFRLVGDHGAGTGTAVYCLSDVAGAPIYGLRCTGLRTEGYEHVLHLQRAAGAAFVNGNLFEGIWAEYYRNLIYLESDDDSGEHVDGNEFWVDGQYRASTYSRGIYCETQLNLFRGRLWDIPTTGVELTSTSANNHVQIDVLDESAISDSGTGNLKLITTSGVVRFPHIKADRGGNCMALLPGTLDSTYFELFARTATPTVRSGFFGYGTVGGTPLTLKNEISGGALQLYATAGNVFIGPLTGSEFIVGPAQNVAVFLGGGNFRWLELFLGRAGATDLILSSKITGQTNDHLGVQADGKILWGPGTTTADTNLYRDGVNRLATDDALQVGRFTAETRDALTPENGDIIYNTDTNKFQGRANGAWVDLH